MLFFSSCKFFFFQFLVKKTLVLDPDPHWNQCGSETRDFFTGILSILQTHSYLNEPWSLPVPYSSCTYCVPGVNIAELAIKRTESSKNCNLSHCAKFLTIFSSYFKESSTVNIQIPENTVWKNFSGFLKLAFLLLVMLIVAGSRPHQSGGPAGHCELCESSWPTATQQQVQGITNSISVEGHAYRSLSIIFIKARDVAR